MLVAAVLASIIGGVFASLVDADLERLVTAVLTFANTGLLVWQSGKVRRVDDVAALAKRKLGDRKPGPADPPWTGVERRKHG